MTRYPRPIELATSCLAFCQRFDSSFDIGMGMSGFKSFDALMILMSELFIYGLDLTVAL